VKKIWYLLKNRRYEGPFDLADLNVRAQQGEVSQDDYVVEEANFEKGQMIYQKVSELLPKSAFKHVLSAPEINVTKTPTQATQNIETVRPTAQSSQSLTSQSSHRHQESVSAFSEWFSNLRFGPVVGFGVVVLAATWFFDRNNSIPVARQPARYMDSRSDAPAQKQQVQREIVRTPVAPTPAREENRVERLMPSERPRAVVGRPERPQALPQTLEAAPARSRQGVGIDNRRERGLASESDFGSNEFNADDGVDDFQDRFDSRDLEAPEITIDPYYDDDGMAEPAIIDVIEDDYY
jgi:hypothetical protein